MDDAHRGLRRTGMPMSRVTPLLAVLLLAAPASSQTPPGTGSETPFQGEVSVGYVLVPVVVRGRSGYVTSLKRQDFLLQVDGRPVHVDSFEWRAEAPLSVVFLQDLSGSMATGGRLEASKEALSYFLDQAKFPDEFAIATFAGNQTEVEVPFTSDVGALREATASWEAYGKTALHDAVAWLPDISTTGRNAKRVAVLITDGADNASTIPPPRAREMVKQAELPTYVLGLDSGSPYDLDTEGHKVYRYADLLNLLALTSGGHYFPISGPDDLKEAIVAIAEDLRNQYVLGFPTTGVGASGYHRIRVQVKKRTDLRVIARQGYRGTLPAPPAAASSGG